MQPARVRAEDRQSGPPDRSRRTVLRLVKCARESAGKRQGTSGNKIGNVHLKWAFSEAAALFLRANPDGLKYKARLEKKYGKAKALSLLAHKMGRAVYYMLLRGKAFDMKKFLAA